MQELPWDKISGAGKEESWWTAQGFVQVFAWARAGRASQTHTSARNALPLPPGRGRARSPPDFHHPLLQTPRSSLEMQWGSPEKALVSTIIPPRCLPASPPASPVFDLEQDPRCGTNPNSHRRASASGSPRQAPKRESIKTRSHQPRNSPKNAFQSKRFLFGGDFLSLS